MTNADAPFNILRIDASARQQGSQTRLLTGELVDVLAEARPGAAVVERDLGLGLPLLDDALVTALRAAPDERTPEQSDLLAVSEELIAELRAADAIVVGLPIYNFHVPAAFKAWIDLVCRARETFRYSESGPVGLLKDRPVWIVIASGGTQLHSDADFVTDYVRHVFKFVGISDIRFIEADRLMFDGEAKLKAAHQAIARAADALR